MSGNNTMNIPKWLIISICLVVIGGAISHLFSSKKPHNPNIESQLQQVPSNEQLIKMTEAIKTGNTDELEKIFENLNAPSEAKMFSRAVLGGTISGIWGVQRQRGHQTLAIIYDIKYNNNYSIQKEGSAILVMYLADSRWVIESVFPGAILVPLLSLQQ